MSESVVFALDGHLSAQEEKRAVTMVKHEEKDVMSLSRTSRLAKDRA